MTALNPLTVYVGSTALRYHNLTKRVPKDLDLISEVPYKSLSPNADVLWDERLRPFVEKLRPLADSFNFVVAPIDFLYTLKVSHSYWDLPHTRWEKHISDIRALKKAGAVLDIELHTVLYAMWEERWGKKRVNLYMDKSEFFDDAVKRIYDHDSIHDAVRYYDRPLYMEVHVPGQEVAQSTSMIKALSKERRDRLFREEIYVTALERWVIPGTEPHPITAYRYALKKMITSLSKGWSARYLLDNIEDFIMPEVSYDAWLYDNEDRLKGVNHE